MTKFGRSEFEHLQKLCRLNCTPEEEEGILHSLQNVLSYFKQLEEIDTQNVVPCTYVLTSQSKTPLREDVVKDLLPQSQFLVSEHTGGMVRVPTILKES